MEKKYLIYRDDSQINSLQENKGKCEVLLTELNPVISANLPENIKLSDLGYLFKQRIASPDTIKHWFTDLILSKNEAYNIFDTSKIKGFIKLPDSLETVIKEIVKFNLAFSHLNFYSNYYKIENEVLVIDNQQINTAIENHSYYAENENQKVFAEKMIKLCDLLNEIIDDITPPYDVPTLIHGIKFDGGKFEVNVNFVRGKQ